MLEKNIFFICIGSNKVVGDLLGPLVGSYLKQKFESRLSKEIYVFGDLENPVNYNNIDNIVKIAKNNGITVLIDSAIGNQIGKIVINSGELYLGSGIKKCKKICGDICIKGIVAKDFGSKVRNFDELYNTKFSNINEMAIEIVKSLNV